MEPAGGCRARSGGRRVAARHRPRVRCRAGRLRRRGRRPWSIVARGRQARELAAHYLAASATRMARTATVWRIPMHSRRGSRRRTRSCISRTTPRPTCWTAPTMRPRGRFAAAAASLGARPRCITPTPRVPMHRVFARWRRKSPACARPGGQSGLDRRHDAAWLPRCVGDRPGGRRAACVRRHVAARLDPQFDLLLEATLGDPAWTASCGRRTRRRGPRWPSGSTRHRARSVAAAPQLDCADPGRSAAMTSPPRPRVGAPRCSRPWPRAMAGWCASNPPPPPSAPRRRASLPARRATTATAISTSPRAAICSSAD